MRMCTCAAEDAAAAATREAPASVGSDAAAATRAEHVVAATLGKRAFMAGAGAALPALVVAPQKRPRVVRCA